MCTLPTGPMRNDVTSVNFRWIELMSIASRPQLPVATPCRQATELVRTVIVDSFHDPSTDADRSWKELETPGIQHHVKCRKYTRRRPLTGPRAVGGHCIVSHSGFARHHTASSLYVKLSTM